jgi:hypothetical protein
MCCTARVSFGSYTSGRYHGATSAQCSCRLSRDALVDIVPTQCCSNAVQARLLCSDFICVRAHNETAIGMSLTYCCSNCEDLPLPALSVRIAWSQSGC